ncbi:unnamed protein product [Anisakis simplex]|uniref:Uncharacterized protein n=1 Tax=Anisakis simplex TaxID=6269 RepID=A0A0M3K5N9_ANISI|nr:unnamed protein product [Anisakis simplex]
MCLEDAMMAIIDQANQPQPQQQQLNGDANEELIAKHQPSDESHDDDSILLCTTTVDSSDQDTPLNDHIDDEFSSLRFFALRCPLVIQLPSQVHLKL